jgi:hypothetical protein
MPQPERRRQKTLWLNASALSDEDFEEFVSMVMGYEGDILCIVVRNGKKYKMPVNVNYCRGLVAELGAFVAEKDIKLVE